MSALGLIFLFAGPPEPAWANRVVIDGQPRSLLGWFSIALECASLVGGGGDCDGGGGGGGGSRCWAQP